MFIPPFFFLFLCLSLTLQFLLTQLSLVIYSWGAHQDRVIVNLQGATPLKIMNSLLHQLPAANGPSVRIEALWSFFYSAMECWLVWSFASLVVIPSRCESTLCSEGRLPEAVLPAFCLLLSPLLLHALPWTLWSRCLILDWTLCRCLFSTLWQVWQVVGSFYYPLSTGNRCFLMRSESITHLST